MNFLDNLNNSKRPPRSDFLKVTLSTWGRFHFFHLARQLEKRGMLQLVCSTYPRFKLRDEIGIPSDKIRTDPYLHLVMLALQRIGAHHSLIWGLNRMMIEHHDRWLDKTCSDCDVVIALSGSGATLGSKYKQRGALYVCDRGSPHIRWEAAIMEDEFRRYGLSPPPQDRYSLDREEFEYQSADMIVVPSAFAASTYLARGVPGSKISVIPYGSRLERFFPEGQPEPEYFSALFVGGVSLRKGIFDLIEGFSLLKCAKKRLRIVGDVETEVGRLLRHRRLENVTLMGNVRNEKLRSIYSTSDVLILPSISDGFGMVMGEALACGCPVIASENTGGRDILDEGVDGFIVPIRAPAEIALRLQKMVEDASMRTRMRQAAREKVENIAGWDQYGERYTQLLEMLSALKKVR